MKHFVFAQSSNSLSQFQTSISLVHGYSYVISELDRCMHFFNDLKKELGFTLVEVMIAVAITGGVVLAAMKLMSMQQDHLNKSYVESNRIEAWNAISSALVKKEACEETFARSGTVRPQGVGTAVDKIFMNVGHLIFEQNVGFGQQGAAHAVKISQMVLKNYTQVASNRGLADFHVTFSSKGHKDKTEKMIIGVVLENGFVKSCVSPNEASFDCVGGWSRCSKDCDGGQQQYQISYTEKNGGESCPYADKEVRACNTQSCAGWETSAWSACSGGSGFWTYGDWGSCTGKTSYYTGPYCDGGILYFCSSCSWVGTQSKIGTCNFSADSGSQTRTVVCKKYGVTVPDSECGGTKPATTQQCTPTNSSVCGPQSGASRSCTPTDSSKCTYTEECSEAGSSC